MARGVCEDDPRTLAQRRSDALGALGAGSTVLSCGCANPNCPAVVDDGRASSIVVHVIAEAASTEATRRSAPARGGTGPRRRRGRRRRRRPGRSTTAPSRPPSRRSGARPPCSFGGGIVPAPLLAELIAHGAKVKLVGTPTSEPEPRYRPSTALDEFVRTRDLTCRAPGCDRTAVFADIDHTVAYPAGLDPSRQPQVLLPNSSFDQDVLARLLRPPARRRHRRGHHADRAHLHHPTRQQPVLPRLGHHHTRTTGRPGRPRVSTAP